LALADDGKAAWECAKSSIEFDAATDASDIITTVLKVEPMIEGFLRGNLVATVDLINYFAE